MNIAFAFGSRNADGNAPSGNGKFQIQQNPSFLISLTDVDCLSLLANAQRSLWTGLGAS